MNALDGHSTPPSPSTPLSSGRRIPGRRGGGGDVRSRADSIRHWGAASLSLSRLRLKMRCNSGEDEHDAYHQEPRDSPIAAALGSLGQFASSFIGGELDPAAYIPRCGQKASPICSCSRRRQRSWVSVSTSALIRPDADGDATRDTHPPRGDDELASRMQIATSWAWNVSQPVLGRRLPPRPAH